MHLLHLGCERLYLLPQRHDQLVLLRVAQGGQIGQVLHGGDSRLLWQGELSSYAYLHVMRADFFGVQKADVMPVAREKYKGVLVSNMGYSAEEAEAAIAAGQLDAVAFGTAFLANPDLPARIKAKAPSSQALYFKRV